MSSKNQLNKQQAKYLGQPISTARSQLCKNLLFEYVKRAGDTLCYRCGKIIDNVDEFTIEHKSDWRYQENAAELFFDIDNICFSHCSCNSKFTSGKRRSDNKHGFKGIYAYAGKTGTKYQAAVVWKGSKTYSSPCDSPEEAAIAYDKLAVEIQGEKAVTNRSLGRFK